MRVIMVCPSQRSRTVTVWLPCQYPFTVDLECPLYFYWYGTVPIMVLFGLGPGLRDSEVIIIPV